MTLVGGLGLGVGTGPGSGLRFSGHGRIRGQAAQGVAYPSPFFDIAHTYYPTTVKQLFRWCRYYFLTNPLINTVAFKLAEYPITDIFVEHESSKVVSQWEDYLQDHLRYRAFQTEVGLDFFVYGNAFISVGYPMMKSLSCPSCKWSKPAAKCRENWVFTNYSFRLSCPQCGTTGDAHVHDFAIRNPSGIKLIRWNPEDIEITYNDITGKYTYYYTIPALIRNDIIIGRKEVVEDVPQLFIQALKEQKGIVLSAEKLFHMKRPSLATLDRGWGVPLMLGVLKDTFYLQLMKKAQEAILLEHIVPLRVLFPQPASGTADPFTSINLVDWRDHVATEIARWRLDNNYIPILPLPIGTQTIGGDGKALLMTAEIAQWSEQIITGMGVPREFVFGGMSYAGTNVSMRMLENSFLGYVLRHKSLLRFVMQEVASFMKWPLPNGRFKPFKMADDVQQKALLLQANQLNKISDTTLLAALDLDQEQENKLMLQETEGRIAAMRKQQLALADMQGEASLITGKYQLKQQQAMAAAQQLPAQGEPGGPDAGGGTPGGQEAAPADPNAAQPMAAGAPGMPMAPAPSPSQEFAEVISSGIGLKNRMNGGGADLQSMAMMQAQQLSQLDPTMQQMAVQNLQSQSPELADLVKQYLAQIQQSKPVINGAQVDARPLPDQRSPRRAGASV